MADETSSEQAGTGAIAALAIVFLPGLFGVPFLFTFLLAVVAGAAGAAVWVFPHLWTQVSDWAIFATTVSVLLIATAIQVVAWWNIRSDVSVAVNGVIVVVFSLYVALAAGGVRLVLAQADRDAYRWSDELAEARRKAVAASLTDELSGVDSRRSVVNAVRADLATCNIAALSGLADHFAYWRGRVGQLTSIDRQAPCTVWVWKDTNLRRLLPYPSREKGLLVSVQPGTISGPRIWFSESVGLVPETFPDFPVTARPAIEQALSDPRKADLQTLINLQAEYEQRREDRLRAELRAAQDKGTQPAFSFADFAIASIGQFVGAFGDVVKPVSRPAQSFEIIIGLLRTLFALVFFERLVKARRNPQAG